LEGSLSPFVVGIGGVDSIAVVFWTCPFIDEAFELLSPFESLARLFGGAGLLFIFSGTPLMPPFTDKLLPLREDL
jgi:hypothetical protein